MDIDFKYVAKLFVQYWDGDAYPLGEVTGDIGCHPDWGGISSVVITEVSEPLADFIELPFDDDIWVKVEVDADIVYWASIDRGSVKDEYLCHQKVAVYMSEDGDIITSQTKEFRFDDPDRQIDTEKS